MHRPQTTLHKLLLGIALSGRLLGAVELVAIESETPAFPLVVAGIAAPLVLPPNSPEVVKIAAKDLAEDIAAVSGATPEILTGIPADKDRPRVELVLDPALSGRWEAFHLSAKPSVLTIAGSDKRGLAYGIYELSRRIGVSPWQWWADVPMPRQTEIKLSLGDEPIDQPAVKYRGIFINDEDWGLEPWASKTFEPEVNNIGPKTHGRILELRLRLRANCIRPGMHPTTIPFHRVPGNAATADRYAIVWPDDNYGYIRRYGTPEEQTRRGGLGVYYHVSYSGLPFAWLWFDTLPPALTWSEMTRAYEQGGFR